jgi:hypothetical protein
LKLDFFLILGCIYLQSIHGQLVEVSFSKDFLLSITASTNHFSYQQHYYTPRPTMPETDTAKISLYFCATAFDYFSLAFTGYVLLKRGYQLHQELSLIQVNHFWQRPYAFFQKTIRLSSCALDIAILLLQIGCLRAIAKLLRKYSCPKEMQDNQAYAGSTRYPANPANPAWARKYLTSSSQKRNPPPKNPLAFSLLTKSSAPNAT